MKNKVLVKIYVPNIDEEYEIFIPTNESISKVLSLIVKSIQELADIQLEDKEHYLFDPEKSQMYMSDQIVRDTNIKNSKRLILI